MNKALIYNYILAIIFIPVLAGSCTKADPIIPNEGELITTIQLQFTDTLESKSYILRFTDLDGDGGESPVIEADTLPANKQLHLNVSLYNELSTPAINLTEEIKSEGTAHQFFYETSLPGFTLIYADTDSLGNPVGIENEVFTGTGGNGNIRLILRHLPDKFADGVSEGDYLNAGGETDIEVLLSTHVE